MAKTALVSGLKRPTLGITGAISGRERFNKAGANMDNDSEAGDALEEVHRIHPLVDRLRNLLQSATALDLKASNKGYWSDYGDEGRRAMSSP